MHSRIPLGRLIGFWALNFVLLYVASFFLFALSRATANPLVGAVTQLAAPLFYFFFGWLYFRKAGLANWEWRFVAMIVWLVCSLLASAFLIKPVYGYEWTLAIHVNVLKGQGLNMAALIAAAYAAHTKKAMSANVADIETLEGPKF